MKKLEKRIEKLLELGWKWDIWENEDGEKHKVITYAGPEVGYTERDIEIMKIGDFYNLIGVDEW